MQTFLIMVTNWWPTAVGFLGGAALYLFQVGLAFPTTREETYQFILAVIIGGLGLTGKSATTGSTPGAHATRTRKRQRETGRLPLPVVALMLVLSSGGIVGCQTARWDAPAALTAQQRIEYEAGEGLLVLIRAVNVATARGEQLRRDGAITRAQYQAFAAVRLEFRQWWQPVYATFVEGGDVAGHAAAFYEWQAKLVDAYLKLTAKGVKP